MNFWIKYPAFSLLFLMSALLHAQKSSFLTHSHNDYEQEEPLTKALSLNFNSIEVDIFEFNGNIVVSHDNEDLGNKPLLKQLYLQPLSQYTFKSNQTIILLVDLKMEGSTILELLHDEISRYPNLFKSRNVKANHASLQVVLSGSVDKEYVLSNNKFHYFYIDGRLEDLKKNYNTQLVPLISADIEELYRWRKSKKTTKKNLKPLIEAIRKVHEQDKIIRFWNTPDESDLWDILISLNVDIIGVDNLDKFMQYSSKF